MHSSGDFYLQYKDAKLLLCRPQAGLADILSQIGKCVRYADQFDRLVVVETDFPNAAYFRDEFLQYFISHDSKLVLTSRDRVSTFDQLAAAPTSFSGRINSYRAQYSAKFNAYVDSENDEVISFDFNLNHAEPLLLCHSAGGGMRKTKIALRRLSLSPMMKVEVQSRLEKIGTPYSSIHIRNSDFTTDFKTRVGALQGKIKGPIFVATDNREALEFCVEMFGAGRVFNFATLPDESGKPIHSNVLLDAKRSNVDAICDLILLASAQTYYFFPLSNPHLTGATYSGFSKLAEFLHKDKALRRQFVDAEFFGFSARMRLRLRKILYRALGLASTFMPTKSREH